MSRPHFARVSAPPSQAHDTVPLLSHKLADLPPREYTDDSLEAYASPLYHSRSVSPPNEGTSPRYIDSRNSSYKDHSTSPSPSRTRISRAYNHNQSIYSYNGEDEDRQIPSGIPPPITQSMFLTQHPLKTALLTTSSRTNSSIRFRSDSPSASRSPGQARSIYTHASRSESSSTTPRPIPSYIAVLVREEKVIQKDVQALLDAQAAGLSKGRGGGGIDDASSEGGSSTPTAYLSTSQDLRNVKTGVTPVRQPKARKIGLKSARAGISQALKDLETANARQEEVISRALSDVQRATRQLEAWKASGRGFDKAIKDINTGSESKDIESLNEQLQAVRSDIRDLEEKLLSMRTRERQLKSEVDLVANKRSAQLSSFLEGKKVVQAEVDRFLNRPGEEVKDASALSTVLASQRDAENASEEDIGAAMFLELPPRRRTAEMAFDFLSVVHKSLASTMNSTKTEKSALVEGQQLWASSLQAVSKFEDELKKQMREPQDERTDSMRILKAQVGKMDKVVEKIEGNLRIAEDKGWTLLICAIGAEFEAFREGRELLSRVLGQMGGTGFENGPFTSSDASCKDDQEPHNTTSNSKHSLKPPSRHQSNGLDELVEDTAAFHTAPTSSILPPAGTKTDSSADPSIVGEQGDHQSYEPSESDDEGPHPDLLTELSAEADD